MWPDISTDVFVGRRGEVARLRELVDGVARGHGGCVLVEGEPGIGKSALLSAGLADAARLGCETLWAGADELDQRFPLQVMLDCLRVDARSADPARAPAAALLRGEHQVTGWLGVAGDPTMAMIECLLEVVDRLCAVSPLVLVVDDLHWADEASLIVWQRLCRTAEQAPLLLMGAYRPVPPREELARLRRALLARGGVVLSLESLPAPEVSELVGALVGAPAGPELLRSAAQATGNPLYLRETVEALVRENAIRVGDGWAELAGEVAEARVPASLAAALAQRLGFLSAPTRDALRVATLLGSEFTVTDLATAVGGDLGELMRALEEAVASGVMDASGPRLRFRHPLIRTALFEAIPAGLRGAIQRQVAQALAEAGAPMERVAQQLSTGLEVADAWVLDWLVANAPALVHRAPRVAADLLEMTIRQVPVGDGRYERLERAFIAAAAQLARPEQVEWHARGVLARTPDPDVAAEVVWALANTLTRGARFGEALAAVRDMAGDPRLAASWVCRLRSLEGLILSMTARHAEAETVARQALADGERAADPVAISYALHVLSVRCVQTGDTAQALEYVTRGLSVIGDNPQMTDRRILLAGNRAMILAALDRSAEAIPILQDARILAERIGSARVGWLQTFACMLHYRSGTWDDAQAELESVGDLLDTYSFPLLYHGLAALIAVHRDHLAEAQRHLDAVKDWRIDTAVPRLNSSYLLLALAAVAERRGRTDDALAVLRDTLKPEYETDYRESRHDWLAQVARLARSVGDTDTEQVAVRVSQADADRSPLPAQLAAAQHCRAIVTGDGDLALEAAGYYRASGQPLSLAGALEDAAIVLAGQGATHRARALLSEAVEVYGSLGAVWDIRRADARARIYGVRRGQRGQHRRATTGWESLTRTELTVAHLVGQGRSNPEIAAELFLSRRTVQTHVSHILTKLAARSRIEIARQATDHRAAAGVPKPAGVEA